MVSDASDTVFRGSGESFFSRRSVDAVSGVKSKLERNSG
jgi:hypothetical protein